MTMTPERWQQIKTVLAHALELEAAQRSAYLDEASAGDAALRAEVEQLLGAEDITRKDFLGEATATRLASVARFASSPDSGLLDSGPDLNFESSPDSTVDSRADSRLDSSSDSSVDGRIGQRIGPYRIVEGIGEGGMGAVYRAVRDDDEYQKQVAIKLIQAGKDSAFVVSRFRNERQILASLDHPNIARLLDGGTTSDGAPYVVMELIEGEPIDDYCDHHRLPTSERLRIFLQVCAAVQFAHQRLIIHRDIKPGNILVGADGVPKLLDFGIAKLLDPEGGEDATMTVLRALTPGYASPEQIKGGTITTASDVYSLGVVLYELLTGHSPYRIANQALHELARAVCETDPERPSTVVTRTVTFGHGAAQTQITPASTSMVRDGTPEKLQRGLRGDLDNIVLMALRKEPELRYASVEQFAEDIRRHLTHRPVTATRGTIAYRAGKFVARHKAGVLASAVVAVTLIGGIVATVQEAQIARRQAAIAQAERARAQRRFDDVRKLANSLIFEVHDSIRDLPGSTPARKLITDRAVQYLDSLAKDASGDSGLQRDLAWAYHRIGQVQGDTNQGNLGETDAMLASMNKAVALFEEVAKANPNNPIDQLDVAFANRLLGTIAPTPEERRRHIDQALAITAGLLKTGADDPKLMSERSLELPVLASLQDAAGDAPAALESYRQGMAMKKELLARHPEYPHVKQGLGNITALTSVELAELGSRKEALQLNSDAIAVYESLLASEKDNARAARELAAAHYSRANILMAEKDFAGALENYRKALSIVKPLKERDPENVMLRVDFGGGTFNVGKALVAMGRVNEGLPLIEEGIRELEREFNTDAADAPPTAAAAYVWKGEALMKTGKFSDAVASDRKGISILEGASRSAGPLSPVARDVAAPYVKLGDVLASAGKAQEAEEAYRKALAIAEPLSGSSPHPRVAYVLADAYFGLGELARKAAQQSRANPDERLRQWRQARDWYQKSEAAWRHVENPGFVNGDGFECGSPARVRAAHAAADAALRQEPAAK